MARPRNRPHILVPAPPRVEGYKPHLRAMDPFIPAPASRAAHGRALTRALELAVQTAHVRRAALGVQIPGAKPGMYVEFEGVPGVPLDVAKLESRKQGIELVAVRTTLTEDEKPKRVDHATVFVPEGKEAHYLKRFEQYAQDTPRAERERRHEKMLDPVARLGLAALRELWTDDPALYPADDEVLWWEVWLRWQPGVLNRFLAFAQFARLQVGHRRLVFDDRMVVLAHGSPHQLVHSLDLLSDVAELRRAKETAAFFIDLAPAEQGDWVRDLLSRVSGPGAAAPSVCLLDTGVNRGHPLLAHALAERDCQTCDPRWGLQDNEEHEGHGTAMAGLALLGDLTPLLAGQAPVHVTHVLESVKILPPPPYANDPDLYGAVTAEAVNRAEVQEAARNRVFCMTVTARGDKDRGQPTLWAATVDALAAGRSLDPQTDELRDLEDPSTRPRLFVLSGGNVRRELLAAAHLDRSDLETVHDPAQAWNALTVGAHTEKAVVRDAKWNDWEPVSRPGELSPWSTTSVSFADAWPIKPDVVFEGGNVVKRSDGEISFPCEELSLLSTHFKPAERAFALTWATSAAAAQVAGMAAQVMERYPRLWPETVRALLVHSARWTPAMKSRFGANSAKRARLALLRRYGYGVPDLERATRSAADSLTLIVQGHLRPFRDGRMGEMHLHYLPWPREVLHDLGHAPVRMRVTLSYFIEPNPGRRGWRQRYRYPSHGLRFDVKSSLESLDEFRKRLNQKALDDDEQKPSGGGSTNWYLGEQARNRGSIHSDLLERCTAAELAPAFDS